MAPTTLDDALAELARVTRQRDELASALSEARRALAARDVELEAALHGGIVDLQSETAEVEIGLAHAKMELAETRVRMEEAEELLALERDAQADMRTTLAETKLMLADRCCQLDEAQAAVARVTAENAALRGGCSPAAASRPVPQSPASDAPRRAEPGQPQVAGLVGTLRSAVARIHFSSSVSPG